jgi:hypothetical protein
MTLKGQYIEKNWPRKNSFKLLIFSYLFKKMLSAYMENKINGGKITT